MEAGLIQKEDSLYGITITGKNAYELLTKSEIANLPIDEEDRKKY